MHATSCSRRVLGLQPLGLLAALGLTASIAAAASDVRIHVRGHGYPDSTAFDLHLVREDLAADYDDGDAATLRLRRVGISLYETLNASSRIGIRLGHAGFRQSGRPATAGLDPSGHFLELDFAGAWPADGRLQAGLEASLRHVSVDDSDDSTGVELDWEILELRPLLRVAPTTRLRLALGATLIAVDGSERLRSPVRATTDFSADEGGGGFLALEYHRDAHDVIALRLRGGNPQGIALAFEHRY